MKSIYLESQITFNGQQLEQNWIQETTNSNDDVMIAFEGPTKLILNDTPHTILENADVFLNPKMLHFIVQHSNTTYKELFLHQRLLINILNQNLPPHTHHKALNIYYKEKQLSITHLQVNDNASIFHVGLFLKSEKKPPIQGLEKFKFDIKPFAAAIMQTYVREIALIPQLNPKENNNKPT